MWVPHIPLETLRPRTCDRDLEQARTGRGGVPVARQPIESVGREPQSRRSPQQSRELGVRYSPRTAHGRHHVLPRSGSPQLDAPSTARTTGGLRGPSLRSSHRDRQSLRLQFVHRGGAAGDARTHGKEKARINCFCGKYAGDAPSPPRSERALEQTCGGASLFRVRVS